jgi:hypothetical protein
MKLVSNGGKSYLKGKRIKKLSQENGFFLVVKKVNRSVN